MTDGNGAVRDPFYAPRELTYVTAQGRWLTDYEVSICHAQGDLDQFDDGGWYLLSGDGSGSYREDSTALHHPNWFEYRDPSGLWQRNYVALQAEQERAVQSCLETARSDGAYSDMDRTWCRDILACYYEAYACCEWGLFLALARCVREALSDTVTMSLLLSCVDRVRHEQNIAELSLELAQEVPGYEEGLGRQVWLQHDVYAATRGIVERLMAAEDWVEIAFVIGLLFDPLIANTVLSRFLRRFAPANGDIVTPAIIMAVERDRLRQRGSVQALVRMLLADQTRDGRPVPTAHNRQVMQRWLRDWGPDILDAADSVAPIFDLPTIRPDSAKNARQYVVAECRAVLAAVGLDLP